MHNCNNKIQLQLERIKTTIKFYTKLKILIPPDMFFPGMYIFCPRLNEVLKVTGLHLIEGVLDKVYVYVVRSANPDMILNEEQFIDPGMVYTSGQQFSIPNFEAIRCTQIHPIKYEH